MSTLNKNSRFTQRNIPDRSIEFFGLIDINATFSFWLKQPQPLGRRKQVVVTPKCLFAHGPLGPLAQPAEVQINSRRVEPALEILRRAFRPTGAGVLALAVARDLAAPMLSLRERRQINFARRD